MDQFRDPIFTGCTRPAMLGGVPIVPLILIGGLTLLLSVWLYYFVSGYVSLALVLIASLGLTLGHGLLVLALLLVVRGVGIVVLDLSANALAMTRAPRSCSPSCCSCVSRFGARRGDTNDSSRSPACSRWH